MIKEDLKFSDIARRELVEAVDNGKKCFDCALKGYELRSDEVARQVIPYEIYIDKLEGKYRTQHIKRLADGTCEARAGIVFLDVVSNIERISDHALNIAQTILNKNKYVVTEE